MKITGKYAFRQSLPVMAGYLVLGMGFGVLLETKGYGVFWALAMSLFIYAGSMQYVAIDLLTGGASLISAALMTLMVNARHLFYGISMIERYRDTGAAKPYLIFSLTDETYNTEGIEFAMTALFLVVFTEQWKSTKNHISAVTGVAASVVCLVIFGPDRFVIPAMAAITVLLTLMRGCFEKKEKAGQKND